MLPLLSLASILTTAGSLLTSQVGLAGYTPGSTGYDISSPQCGSTYPTGAFGVVGVNGGYPFVHYNPCLADEYAHSPHAALYINTGYDPLYTQVDGRHTTPECLVHSAPIHGAAEQQVAWAVGCSEASRSMAYAFTIQGIVDTLHRHSAAPIGVYSTGHQWRTITGGLPVRGVRADWVATGSFSAREARARCGSGFSGVPVWFVQYLHGGFDANYVC